MGNLLSCVCSPLFGWAVASRFGCLLLTVFDVGRYFDRRCGSVFLGGSAPLAGCTSRLPSWTTMRVSRVWLLFGLFARPLQPRYTCTLSPENTVIAARPPA